MVIKRLFCDKMSLLYTAGFAIFWMNWNIDQHNNSSENNKHFIKESVETVKFTIIKYQNLI